MNSLCLPSHQYYSILCAGDVRAPFTPRKPGRTSSLRDEEKRQAPPRPPQSKVIRALKS